LSHWLTEELQRLDVPAICIDARHIAAILSVNINKTDKNDARGIADAMRCDLFSIILLILPLSIVLSCYDYHFFM